MAVLRAAARMVVRPLAVTVATRAVTQEAVVTTPAAVTMTVKTKRELSR